jgi:hypothetical protein
MPDWRPIEVDIPGQAFEPRPAPPYGRYRPDTICDGWSTSDFVVRMACVRGYAHRYSGTPRQDAVDVRVHDGTRALVVAVADGVSDAPNSDVGAAVACEHAVAAVLDALDRNPATIDWQRVLTFAARALTGLAGRHSTESVASMYATTLVLGVLRPAPGGGQASVVHVGDSGAWLLHNGQYDPLLPLKAAGSGVVSHAVDPLPRVPERVIATEMVVPIGSVFLVGTDGFGDPLGDGTGLVGDLFADVLATPPPPLRLAHALDFSRETFDDDRTLVAVWPSAGRPS